MTRITCTCEGGSCSWAPKRAFTDCVGPCKTPQVTRRDVSQFFKLRVDYNKPKNNIAKTSAAFGVVMRAQAKSDVTAWSQAMVFTESQSWEPSSGDVKLAWNCNRRILMITPKPHATHLIATKSYAFRVLIENGKPSDVGDYQLHFFDEELGADDANCQDKKWVKLPNDYCPTSTTTPEPTITLPTQPPTFTVPTRPTTTKPPITITHLTTSTTQPGVCKRGEDLTNAGELTIYASVPDGGNCGLNWDFVNSHKGSSHFVALPNSWNSAGSAAFRPYNDHMNCGRCVRLRCSCDQSNKWNFDKCSQGKDSIVMVTDSCPSCQGSGDLDLGEGAWDEVTGGNSPDRFDGSYEFVPCPTEFINGDNTKVRWKSGSSVWWALVQGRVALHLFFEPLFDFIIIKYLLKLIFNVYKWSTLITAV